MVKKIVILLFSVGLFFYCATSRYHRGDQLLKQGMNQKALREYVKILHQDKRKNGTFTDVRAMLGAVSAYYQMQKYDKVQKMCKIILKVDSRNGGALFYAASSLEQQDKLDWAIKFYKQFPRVNIQDPYRSFLEARYRLLMNQELAKNMRAAIKREREIEIDKIPENSIAVLYFVDSEQTNELNSLSKGLAEMLISDLRQINQLKVVDRQKVQTLMEELQLNISDLTDPNIIQRFGKILQARTIVSGGLITTMAELHVTTNLVNVSGSKTFDVDQYSGSFENVLSIQKDILLGILEHLDIQLSFQEQDRLLETATQNFDAFMDYCSGIDLMDQQLYADAAASFKNALEVDPDFSLAREKFMLIDAMSAMSDDGNFFQQIMQARQSQSQNSGNAKKSWRGSPVVVEGPLNRLNRSSFFLDLGAIPSREIRNEAVDITSYGIPIKRQKLPDPPNPPGQN